MAAIDDAIMTTYSSVRMPMVSGRPTEGGLAGYLRFGTRKKAMKPASASSPDAARGPRTTARPLANANTRANRPPNAVL